MFMMYMKTVLLLSFYLVTTYALSLQILGAVTSKANYESAKYGKINKTTIALLVLAILNLIGVPPLPLFWPKIGALSAISTQVSTTQLYVIVAMSNLAILVYSVLWARFVDANAKRYVNINELNFFIAANIFILVTVVVLSPHILVMLM